MPRRPKPNTPKNIIAKVIVNTSLSSAVILCSSLMIKELFVAGTPDLSSFNVNLSTFQYNQKLKNP